MRKLLLALALLLTPNAANAVQKFWNPYSITGAVSGTAGVCRLTITPAITGSGLLAGTTVTSRGITGVTGCNATATISTVVDSTHVELTGTTFGGSGFGGTACLDGGHWTATNTSNWHDTTTTATCGSGGGTVPASADTANFDANSGASAAGTTVVVDASVSGATLTSFIEGTCTCTVDFSVGNPSMTLTGATPFSITGSTTRVLKMGSGTFSLTNAAAVVSAATITNLVFTAGASTFDFTAAINLVSSLGGLTFFNVTFDASGGFISLAGNSSNISGTLTVNAPINLLFPTAGTYVIANLSILGAGSSTNVGFMSSGDANVATVTLTNAFDFQWAAIASMIFSGGTAPTAHNSFDLQRNTGITITPPVGGGSHCIGC